MQTKFAEIEDVRKMADKMMAELIRESALALIAKHGGLRAASRAAKIDLAYLQRLKTGEKVNPSKETLKKLGVKIK